MSKTDIAANVGKHVFEVAGLGRAPFRFTGFSENVFNNGDGTTKPGGCCDYCYTGLRYECHILSSDGKSFKVGTNCVDKTGDAGLLKAYKSSPEFRKLQADKRKAKGSEARESVKAMIEENRELLKSMPHPYGYTDRQTGAPLTALDQVEWMFNNCGNSGITQYRKTLTKIINGRKESSQAVR